MSPRAWFSGLTPYFVYVLFVATLGPLLFGFHLSELNAPEDVIRCKKNSIVAAASHLPQCIRMNPTEWGVVGSMYTLGGLLGALSAGPLAGTYGRRRTMQLTSIFFIVGPVFEALSPNIGVMAVGRLLSGVGAGASVVVVPIYISEISPPGQKGFFGAFTQIMCNVGILVTQLLGYFLSHDQYWRIILAAGGAIGVVQSIGLVLSVESPKYLAEQGHASQAKRVLRSLRGGHSDINEEFSGWGADGAHDTDGTLLTSVPRHEANPSLDEEQTLLRSEDEPSTPKTQSGRDEALSIVQVLRHPEYKKAAFAIIMIMLAQQLSGINSIVMYGVSLLADLLASNSALLNLAVSAVNIIVTTGCAPLPDKLGRKACLLQSLAGMGISSLLLALGIIKAIPILSAVAVVLFVSSFALGLGPVPFMLSAELVGPDAVGATQSIALAANWIATFLVAQFFPLASAALRGKVYFIFAALSAFFFLFISWFVPETKGKKNADEVWGRERRVD
ncbi:Bifunctional purine biosynthesis protein PurH [Kalmusia sp. IMI 367209]|nr:Bifunctional purine biosynthesis protein PurH [Kalmusia sp. IMI 367209]